MKIHTTLLLMALLWNLKCAMRVESAELEGILNKASSFITSAEHGEIYEGWLPVQQEPVYPPVWK